MISQIRGTVESFSENTLCISTGGLSYEVYIPTAVMKGLDGRLVKDANVSLVTYHYYQTDPSKSIPILIGFGSLVEKDFFEKFITVSGVGPKAAVRALSMPIPDIAQAIDSADLPYLKSLPGIGEQRAKEIIAKLQGKMGKFCLMQGGSTNGKKEPPASDAREETIEVLLQLQYKKEEAQDMVRKALARKPGLKSTEEILNEVYKQKQAQK
ncbi:MAG TPA: Holliday junction branch migration protein RuvA [Candidatus Omnitrophota bacterium]|nr:Holliday junction branch migration protein RuvA [Candidatus Omnitrophota bacterium]